MKKLIYLVLVVIIAAAGVTGWYLTRAGSLQLQVLLTHNGEDVSELIDWRVDQIDNPSDHNGSNLYSVIKTINHSTSSTSLFDVSPGVYLIEAEIIGQRRLKRELTIRAGEKRLEVFTLEAGLLKVDIEPPDANTDTVTLEYQQDNSFHLTTLYLEDQQPAALFFSPDVTMVEIRTDQVAEQIPINLTVGEIQSRPVDLRRRDLAASIHTLPAIAADHVEQFTWALTDEQGEIITLTSEKPAAVFTDLKIGTYQLEAGIWRENEQLFSQSARRSVEVSENTSNQVSLELKLIAVKVNFTRRPDAPVLPPNTRRTLSVIETDYKGIPYGYSEPSRWDSETWVVVSPAEDDLKASFAIYANEFIPYGYNEHIAFKPIGKLVLGETYEIKMSEGDGFQECKQIYGDGKCSSINGGVR